MKKLLLLTFVVFAACTASEFPNKKQKLWSSNKEPNIDPFKYVYDTYKVEGRDPYQARYCSLGFTDKEGNHYITWNEYDSSDGWVPYKGYIELNVYITKKKDTKNFILMLDDIFNKNSSKEHPNDSHYHRDDASKNGLMKKGIVLEQNYRWFNANIIRIPVKYAVRLTYKKKLEFYKYPNLITIKNGEFQ